jgi:MGT family glycosyltransferase
MTDTSKNIHAKEKPGRFLFVTFDGGGNMTPTLAIIRRLVQRGHQVTLLGSRALAARVIDTGGSFRAFERSHEPDPPAPGVMAEQAEKYISEMFAFMCSSELTREVVAIAETADVLVADCMMPAALMAGELKRIPTVALVHALYRWFVEGENGVPALDGPMLPYVNQARRSLGLETFAADTPLTMRLFDGATLALALTLEEFDYRLSRPHPNLRYVGPVLDPEASTWKPPGHPLVLISFSSTYMRQEDALRRTFDAMKGIDATAVCTLGHSLTPAQVGAASKVLMHDWIPHGAILPHTAAVVTHAGHSTVMAAFAYGVPMVCMPMGRDQNANADRVATLGAGLAISADAPSGEVRAAIREVLTNPSYRESAQRMCGLIEGLGRGERAVTELENLLS